MGPTAWHRIRAKNIPFECPSQLLNVDWIRESGESYSSIIGMAIAKMITQDCAKEVAVAKF